MGFLKKLFGGSGTIEGLRKAVEQGRFADARLLAEELLEQGASDEERADIEKLQAAAGDALARLNLEEALALQRAGHIEQATDHLQLAEQQACSADLRDEIAVALAGDVTSQPETVSTGSIAASCASCGPQVLEPLASDDLEMPDQDSQFELILASYPPQLAEQYREKGAQFFQAFLLSHSGQDEEAIAHWQQVPDEERDDIYWYELGSAQARCGQAGVAQENLEKALQMNPGLLAASETLVQLLVNTGRLDDAEAYLQQQLASGNDPLFCQVQLTLVCLQQEQPEAALGHARQALAGGVEDPQFLQLAASLLEGAGELEEAEAFLRRLPTSGCGGTMNLALAEFLLRQKRDLARVLDSFNAACGQDPQNPRWQLRVAQTYLARDWEKQGMELLRKVVGDPRLEPALQEEARQLLSSRQG